ncbi:MAG: hypothetical protein RLZZ584_2035 [Pseudomonadota bacterium]|jgi:copper(I)-binding protein
MTRTLPLTTLRSALAHRTGSTVRALLAATWLMAANTLLLAGADVHAHGAQAGTVRIEHPYATPTPPQARVGGVYFRSLENQGKQADRLVGARTPVADSVEIHRSETSDGVMRMRALDALELPPGSKLQLRHGGDGTHLMLLGLKQPLKAGDKFKLTLNFEKGGEREVEVWVQQPRDGAPAADHSAHAAHDHGAHAGHQH